VADGTEAGAVLADGAIGCVAAFAGCGPGCPREEAELDCASDSGVCAVAEDEGGFPDCWAFTLSVSSNEVVITQRRVRIAQPSFRFLPSSSNSKKQRFSGGRARGRRHSALLWEGLPQ
jgi:hypothetical protein